MFDALARLADGHARRVGLVAIAFFLVAGALGGSVADHLDPYGADDAGTESVRADRLAEDAGYRDTAVVVLFEDTAVRTPAGRNRVDAIEARLRSRGDVASVTGFPDTGSRDFVSRDGDATYLAVAVGPRDDAARQDAADGIKESLRDVPGVQVGGPAVAGQQVNEQVETDLRKAELLVFPLLLLLSLLFFRSLVAAILPLMIGALAIVGTFLALRIASEIGSVSIFALNLTTGIGLGLAIDYSLFIVSRYREEIAEDGPGLPAMQRTLATAGRTVLFSSMTVAVAIASLLIFPQRFLYSMGLGGAIVAILAALVSLTVLPAVLTLLGTRVNSLSPAVLRRRAEADARPAEQGFWYRLSRFVARRPVPVATLTALLLIILGLPFLGIRFTNADAQILPGNLSARQVDDVLRADFPPFHDTPIEVVVDGGGPGASAALRRELAGVDGVAEVQPPLRLAGGVTVINAISADPFISEASRATVRDIRALPGPAGADVLVAGGTASFLDLQSSLKSHMPVALAIVIGATLLILFLMTGSVILPVKSLLMNFLNLSAVFGILVLIFQDGRFESLLGYTSQNAIEQTMPILLFAVAFGLSTDYAVFLLSRIKEARDGGASDSDAVAIGLERTGRIVTAAALLFAIAIGAFATSKIIFIKQNGIGTALAVLIDASIIRALLVPSLMELLGKWNWWAPAPLRRLHDRFGLSEGGPAVSGRSDGNRGVPDAERAWEPRVNQASDHPFDRDTAVNPLGGGRYGADIRKSWWVARGPNGGYVGAILLRAILAEVPGRPPRSLTVHYPQAPAEGPAEVEVTVERAGRSASFVSARLVQEGETKALALAALSSSWEGPSYSAGEMPDAQPPGDLPEVPQELPGLPPMFANYRVAPALGEAIFTGGETPRSGGWIRAREPRLLDAPLVVAIMDAWFPVPFVMQSEPIPAPTIDFTVHFRAPLPPEGAKAGDWYLADFHSALARDGFFDEDGELWSAGGHLLAQSRQLALLLDAK